MSEGFLSRLRGCGRASEPGTGAGPRPGPEHDGARGGRGPGLAAGPRFRGAAPGTKDCPTCAGGAGTSPRAASARTREVTSGACQPEKGPARGRRGGTFAATPRPSGRGPNAEAGSAGPARLTFPLTPAGSFIFMRRVKGGTRSPAAPRPLAACPAPLEAPAPVGRPRLPPRGGSFHLVTTQKCVAPAPPPPRPCPRLGGGFLPWEGRRGGSSFLGQVRGDPGLAAPSFPPSKIAPVIILIFKM